MAKSSNRGKSGNASKGGDGAAEVVALNATPERHDVVAMARKFADDLEAGVYGTALNAMLVLECRMPGEHSDIEIFGWGPDTSGLYGLGMLTSALHTLQT